MINPFVPASTKKQLIPFPFGTDVLVTAQTTKTPAYGALEMNRFFPFKTHSFPSRTAEVVMEAGSEPALRFREGETPGGKFSGTNFGYKFPLLGFRADRLDNLTDQVIDRNCHRGGGTRPGDLSDRHTKSHHASLGTPVFILDIQPHETHFGELFQVAQEGFPVVILVKPGGNRFKLDPGKFPGSFLDQFLFFIQFKVHYTSSTLQTGGKRRDKLHHIGNNQDIRHFADRRVLVFVNGHDEV